MKKLIILLFVFLLSIRCGRSQGIAKGLRIDFTDLLNLDGNGGQFAQVFVPDYFQRQGNQFDLVFHLHSATWAAEDEVYKAKANVVLFNIHLGAFSGAYQTYFSRSDRFDTILHLVKEELIRRNILADSTQLRYLLLTSFSAGYAGVREILKSDRYYRTITAIHLADGLHASSNRAVMDEQMKDFVKFARDALNKKKIFRLTHSSIVTNGYQSTTQTADYLLQHLGLRRDSVMQKDEIGTMYARCDSGYFHLRSYLGNTAHDHLQHLYAMDLMVRATMHRLFTATFVKEAKAMQTDFRLLQNFPNPFNAQTAIRYYLPTSEKVLLRIFDARGDLVAIPFCGLEQRGWHEAHLQMNNLASGCYFLLLSAGKIQLKHKMILLK